MDDVKVIVTIENKSSATIQVVPTGDNRVIAGYLNLSLDGIWLWLEDSDVAIMLDKNIIHGLCVAVSLLESSTIVPEIQDKWRKKK